MDDLNFIKKQLEEFIRRYYLNELLKGSILFFSIWLLYFIFILLIEHFLWLSPPYRSFLFWVCIVVSLALLYKFIALPVFKLFRISKGIDELEASRIIGKHFPEVNDKLLNVLQLQRDPNQSDLLLAGIAQKSRELKPVPFKMAVNYNNSLRYLKYAAFPVIIILALIFTGNSKVFSESYTRVIHYKTAYEPPAPFSFLVSNLDLVVEEGSSFTVDVVTRGKIVPENASIHFNDETYFLKSNQPSHFQYTFQGIKENMVFYLSANGVRSRPYEIQVVKVPKLVDFEIEMQYPRYLNRPQDKVRGTGNITIPEGTKVTWNLKTKTTDRVVLATQDTAMDFTGTGDAFTFSKTLFSNTAYQVKTSNEQIKDHETLEYNIEVIKDQFPEIKVERKADTIREENLYFYGNVSDDHSVSALNLVYFEDGEEGNSNKIGLPVNKEVFAEFYYTFPGDLNLERGKNYTFYFEVFDNDGIRGPKRSRTDNYSFQKKSEAEIKEEQLQKQGESIRNLSQSLDKMQMNETELEEMSRLQKEKEQLNFNDRKKLNEFLERQKQQNRMMKNYSEKLKQSLEEETPQESDSFKEELRERLERKEERLEENEALLEELQKYSDKISREELAKKLEELSKQNTTEQKTLEQLLELTKRYYVQEKTQKLASDLSRIAEEQEKISEKESGKEQQEQEGVNKKFEDFQEQMDNLEKENEGLKKPFDLGREKEEEKDIKQEQEKAGENLEQGKKEEAKKNQKSAAQKMKEMSKKMQAMQMMSQGEQLNANIESLRQILSNLLIFSFEQEELLLKFRTMRPNNPRYASELKKQQVLKEHFEHIDDSLFALAVSNPMITEKITSKLTDIEFDINKSLERLAQNGIPQGTSSQQYVMTGTNELALMLNEVLGNMQEMANPSPSPGGDGEEDQLQDIIISQEELMEKMKEGMQEGENGEPREDGKDGEQGREGKEQNEELSGRQFEIYKQQQILKQQLQNKLKEIGLDQNKSGLIRDMEKVEKDILEKGFTQETLDRMNRITHRLLELQNSRNEQEEEEKRTSRTNLENFNNSAQDQILKAKDYFRSTEILNRQTLPLRQIYKAKVRDYFGTTQD